MIRRALPLLLVPWLAVACAGCESRPAAPAGRSRAVANTGASHRPETARAAAAPTASARTGRAQHLPTVAVRVGPHRIEVELARTPEQRARGLMFRTDLGPDDGMLFVFPRPEPLSFWMKDTPRALSIAFADGDGVIVRIADMEPFDRTPVGSGAPAQLALEMPRGWFRRHGVVEGDRIVPLEPLPPAR